MNMKDLFTHLKAARLVAPGIVTTTPAGIVVDLLGFKSALLLLDTGIGGITFTGTNSITWELQDSPDNVTFTDVDITKVLGLTDAALPAAGIIRQFTAAHAAASLDPICYIGGQRFIKLIPNFNGTHATGTFVAANALLGDAAYQPVNTPISSTN